MTARLHGAGGMPLPARVRQAWDDLSPPQRVNRVLYGLALASMLALLLELGVGGRSSDVDLAGTPGSTTPRTPATTRPVSPAPSVAVAPEPLPAGGLSLADIVAQVTGPSGGEGSPAAGRPRGAGTPARAAARPSGGATPGGSSPSAGPSSPAPGPTRAQPEQPPTSPSDPGPAVTSPTTAPATATSRPRTVVTFDLPDFDLPGRTGTTRRDRR